MIVNAMVDTNRRNETPTRSFIWSVVDQYKLNWIQVIDANKELFKFASGSSIGLPFHVAIDLRTMKVVDASSGRMTKAKLDALVKQTLGGDAPK
jgi:hypothetical protein